MHGTEISDPCLGRARPAHGGCGFPQVLCADDGDGVMARALRTYHPGAPRGHRRHKNSACLRWAMSLSRQPLVARHALLSTPQSRRRQPQRSPVVHAHVEPARRRSGHLTRPSFIGTVCHSDPMRTASVWPRSLGKWKRGCEASGRGPAHPFPISSGIGRPRSTIGVGRPLKSRMSVLAESIPRWW